MVFGVDKDAQASGRQGSRTFAIIIASFAAFGGFLYGYDTGYIAGVKEMPFWQQRFGSRYPDGTLYLPSSTDSLVTSILSAGTFFGALAAYPAGDFLGRRFGIIAFLALFCIGVACQTAAKDLATFVVGRVFAGLGVGGTSCLVPIYQAEVAPKAIRGGIVSGYQWMITIGLLIAAIVVQQTKNYNGISSWQLPIGLQFIWAFILGTGLAILPESPRYLIMKGRDDKALRSLSRIYSEPIDSPIVNEEFSEIAANIHHERSIGATSYIDCFRSGGAAKTRKRVLTGIGLQALQQLTGINFIFYYGTQFFSNSNIKNPFLTTVATNVVNVGMTVPGIWAVDRFGRRFLLLYGAAGMAVAQIIVAAVGDARPNTDVAAQKVLVGFVCIFIGHFAATWGPLAWVVTSEIYPTHIRGKAMSMSTASNWLLNFGIGYATPYLVNSGPGNAGLHTNVFWIWSGCCVLGFIFIFFMLPECRGLSLEQVDILYRNTGVFGSNAYRKKILAENIHDEDNEAYQSAVKDKTSGKTEHVEKRDLA